jgi:hypothetical protein
VQVTLERGPGLTYTSREQSTAHARTIAACENASCLISLIQPGPEGGTLAGDGRNSSTISCLVYFDYVLFVCLVLVQSPTVCSARNAVAAGPSGAGDPDKPAIAADSIRRRALGRPTAE